jgi:nitronate monooxygenase
MEVCNSVDFLNMNKGGDEMFDFSPYKRKIRGDNGEIFEMLMVQAGMGYNISSPPMAAAASRAGFIPVVSTIGARAAMETMGYELTDREASKIRSEEALRLAGNPSVMGGNFMTLTDSCNESIKGALDGGTNLIIAGAGIARNLRKLVTDPSIACIPIVSSLEVLELIFRAWKGALDGVVVEWKKAGGHLGFSREQIADPRFLLEDIIPPIIQFAKEHGNFPVIVAGGIWDRSDVIRCAKRGARGVQVGTRFLLTKYWTKTLSGYELRYCVPTHFRNAILSCKKEDIIIATEKGSPAPMPLRILRTSPGYLESLAGAPVVCRLCYMLHDKKCRALEKNSIAFCICEGLYQAQEEFPDPNRLGPIYTVGANAWRFADEGRDVIFMDELMAELTGFPCPQL